MCKKILACVMACMVCMSFATQAFALGNNVNSVGSVAADVDTQGNNPATSNTEGITGYDDTQDFESDYQSLEVADDTVEADCDVYATQATGEDIVDDNDTPDDPSDDEVIDGTVMVVVPKVVILDGKTGTGKYVVKVKGNIAGNEVITVAPDATVTMKQDGKDDVVATITQDIQRFAYKDTTAVADADDLAKEVTTSYYTAPEATIQANGLTAGSWHGAFVFNISFATV